MRLSKHCQYSCEDPNYTCEECKHERELFEEWALENGFHLSIDIHRNYSSSKINWMWKAWIERSQIK